MSSIHSPQPAAPAAGRAQPAAARVGAGSNSFFKNLGIPGLLWILAGLLICASFFLPWFTSRLMCNDPVCGTAIIKDAHFASHYAASPTGFSIANGSFALNTTGSAGTIHETFSFLLLWLVFIGGLALIALPLLLALRKMHANRTRGFLLVLALLLLAVEVGYAMSAAQALPQTKLGLATRLNGLALSHFKRQAVFDFSTGPALGFWLALGATLVAGAASVYDLFASSLGRRFDIALFWRNLGLAGQVILLAGLALGVAFFLPWFSTPDPLAGPNGGYQITAKKPVTVVLQTVSGWNTAANGLQTPFFAGGSCTSCVTPHVSIFLSLWLVPLAALGLLAVAWMMGRGVLWRRMAAILACVICLVALTLEALFLLEVQSLQSYDEQVFQAAGKQLAGTAYSVTWGFWAAMAVTGLALLVSGFLLLQRHKSVTGRLVGP